MVYELHMISEARSHGMDVTTEAYPYAMDLTRDVALPAIELHHPARACDAS